MAPDRREESQPELKIDEMPVKLTLLDRGAVKFGTAGWRAQFPSKEHPDGAFTPERVNLLVQSVAEYVNQQKEVYRLKGLVDEGGSPVVVVGYDHRNQGMMPGTDEELSEQAYAENAARILAGNGIKVELMNRVASTPLNLFTMLHHKGAMLINLTASHNPSADGGIEIFDGLTGGLANNPVTDPIVQKLLLDPSNNADAIRVINFGLKDNPLIQRTEVPISDYVRYLKEVLKIDPDVIRRSGIRVVHDAQHGAGSVIHEVLEELGIADQVVFLNEELDPHFGGKSNSELTPENLAGLAAELLKTGFDLGISNDGDADRSGAVSPLGSGTRFFSGNDMATVMAYGMLKQIKEEEGDNFDPSKYVILRSVVSTGWIDEVAKALGVPPENVRKSAVGFRFLNDEIRKAQAESKKVIIAFEENGGIAVGNSIPYKDGFAGDIKFLDIAAREKLNGRTVEDLFNEAQSLAPRPEYERTDIRFALENESYKGSNGIVMRTFSQIAQDLEAKLSRGEDATIQLSGKGLSQVVEINRLDGVYFKLKNGSWVNIRASGTEPLFRIYVEALTQETNDAVTQWAVGIIRGMEK